MKLPLRIGIYESLYVVTAEREFTHEGIRLLANFAREFRINDIVDFQKSAPFTTHICL